VLNNWANESSVIYALGTSKIKNITINECTITKNNAI
jgi:hypothetical protein